MIQHIYCPLQLLHPPHYSVCILPVYAVPTFASDMPSNSGGGGGPLGHGGHLFDSRVKPREISRGDDRRSLSPQSRPIRPKIDRSRYDRSHLHEHQRANSASTSHSSNAQSLPQSLGKSNSFSNDTHATTAGTPGTPKESMMEALKVLQNSATIQALLKQDPQKSEVSATIITWLSWCVAHVADQVFVKREETEDVIPPPSSAPRTPQVPAGPRAMTQPKHSRFSAVVSPPGSTPDKGWPTRERTTSNHSPSTRRDPPPVSSTSNALKREHSSNASTSSAAKSVVPAPPAPKSREEASLTRELWDIRREMTSLKAKEESLVADIKKLNPAAVLEDSTREKEKSRESKELVRAASGTSSAYLCMRHRVTQSCAGRA